VRPFRCDRTPSACAATDGLNRTNRTLIRALLEPLGLEVEVASNGAEAVTAFAAHTFDLVLMDIRMPVMDGMAGRLP
jgi:CheY-like chemotaxis protein